METGTSYCCWCVKLLCQSATALATNPATAIEAAVQEPPELRQFEVVRENGVAFVPIV